MRPLFAALLIPLILALAACGTKGPLVVQTPATKTDNSSRPLADIKP